MYKPSRTVSCTTSLSIHCHPLQHNRYTSPTFFSIQPYRVLDIVKTAAPFKLYLNDHASTFSISHFRLIFFSYLSTTFSDMHPNKGMHVQQRTNQSPKMTSTTTNCYSPYTSNQSEELPVTCPFDISKKM